MLCIYSNKKPNSFKNNGRDGNHFASTCQTKFLTFAQF